MRDWDQCYQEGFVPWDKGAGAPPLSEWLARHEGEMTGEVLVPGCGLGHDVRVLARQEGARVVGLDVSPTAVAKAEEVSTVGDEEYVLGDLFAPPADWVGRFDWVWEHTCYCAIEPDQRDDYVHAVHSLLKPGGRLLAVFYLNPYDDEHRAGEGPPHGCTEDELRARFAEGFDWVESAVPENAYPGREGKELLVCLCKR